MPTPRLVRLSLLFCLTVLFLDRWLVLHQFGFRYVDDDQAIMWSGASEMARGLFHEPCFYGQPYNSMLEGLFAVPLLWSGLRHEIALPLVTSSLTLFPFLLLAGLLARRGSYGPAAFALAFPVTLSPEFGMVSTIPRGFVTGVFLASFAMLPLFSRRSIFLALAPFFAVLAILANPNSVLLLLPVAILVCWEYRRGPRSYLLGVLGAAPALVLAYLSRRFYVERPGHVVHPEWEYAFSLSDIRWEHLRLLDHISPVLWDRGPLVLVVMLVVIAWLVRGRHWPAAVALFAGLLLLVFSFGLNKVHHGSSNVFLPWSRMFLAVPVLLVLFMAKAFARSSRWLMVSIPLLAAGFLGYKAFVQQAAVERQVDRRAEKGVEVASTGELERLCTSLGRLAGTHKASVLVISWGRYKHLINYGCPCLITDFPRTLEPALDRRTWHMQEMAREVHSNVLLTGKEQVYFNRTGGHHPKVERVGEVPPVFLLRNNGMPLGALLDSLALGLRPL